VTKCQLDTQRRQRQRPFPGQRSPDGGAIALTLAMRETIEWALVASIWLLAVATCGVGQLRDALSGSPHSA